MYVRTAVLISTAERAADRYHVHAHKQEHAQHVLSPGNTHIELACICEVAGDSFVNSLMTRELGTNGPAGRPTVLAVGLGVASRYLSQSPCIDGPGLEIGRLRRAPVDLQALPRLDLKIQVPSSKQPR